MSDPDDNIMATWVLYGACNVGQWCKPSEQWTIDKYTWLTCITGVCSYRNSTTVSCMVFFPNQLACFFELVRHCKFLCWSWQILTIEVRVLIMLFGTTKFTKCKHSHNLSLCQALRAKFVSIYRIKQKGQIVLLLRPGHVFLLRLKCKRNYTEWSKSLCAPDDYSTKKKWWFEDGHHRIHSECGPCYTEHGLREHSSACQ